MSTASPTASPAVGRATGRGEKAEAGPPGCAAESAGLGLAAFALPSCTNVGAVDEVDLHVVLGVDETRSVHQDAGDGGATR